MPKTNSSHSAEPMYWARVFAARTVLSCCTIRTTRCAIRVRPFATLPLRCFVRPRLKHKQLGKVMTHFNFRSLLFIAVLALNIVSALAQQPTDVVTSDAAYNTANP